MKIKTLSIALLSISLHISAQNYIINTLAGNGTAGYSGDGSSAFSAQLSSPSVVAFDRVGNKFIADAANNCIRKIDAAGIITTVAGTYTAGYSGDGGSAVLAKLSNPWGIALDSLNNIYIADTYNNVIRRIDYTTGIITTIVGNGTGGYSGDGGQATAAELLDPAGLTLDVAGNMYVADYGNNLIRKIDHATGIVSTIAGTGNGGYAGDGGAATAADISVPSSLAFDASGNLYFVDNSNSVVRKIDTAGIISTFAGTGVTGSLGDGGPATLAQLNTAFGVTVDLTGNVLIADYGNSRIRQVDATGIITTIAGNGAYGFGGDGGPATSAMMSGPNGVSVDKNGIIYIADWDNNRVRTLTVAATTGIEQITGINNQVTVYPNPNNGIFVIEPKSTLYNAHYNLYDVSGKLVLSQSLNGKTNIDASSLNEGVYNLSITNPTDGGIVNKRLVIVR